MVKMPRQCSTCGKPAMLKPGTQLLATATGVRIHLSVISHTPNNQNNKILIYLKKKSSPCSCNEGGT